MATPHASSFKHLFALSLLALAAIGTAQSFRFVHVTDLHVTGSDKPDSNAAKSAAILKEITESTPQPAFVINTGDMTEAGTTEEFEVYLKTVKALGIKRFDTPGNHDVRWNAKGKSGFTASTKQPPYQSWDFNGVHFVLLDSTMLLSHLGHLDEAMLDWLKTDLKKAGRDTPVVVAMHHWIGRETMMVDNERELLDITRPYNVKLWLAGHGHADQIWNIDGVPAVMSKGLYQGSYTVVEVGKGKLRVLRKAAAKPDSKSESPFVEVASVGLKNEVEPKWTLKASQEQGAVKLDVSRGTLPIAATASYRINGGAYKPLAATGEGWAGTASSTDLVPGEHNVTVRTELPDGRAYLKSSSVRVLGAVGMTPTWSKNIRGAVQSRLVRSGDLVFATTMGGEVIALSAETGAAKWRYKSGGPIFSTPHVTGSSVYVGSSDNNVYSLDRTTGKVKWTAKGHSPFLGSPTMSKGIVCIADAAGGIYGIRANNGEPVWVAKGDGMYQSKVATDGERFFVAGWDNYVRCLDAVTGAEVWKAKFGRSFYFAPAIASPTVGEGKVFVASNDGVLHALDAKTGSLLWDFDGKKVAYSTPLYREGELFISLGDEGRVFCLNAGSGKLKWQATVGGLVYDSSFAISGGNLYIGSVNGTMSALRADDGGMVWQYRLGPGHLLASPAVDEDNVYIASTMGSLFALPAAPVTQR